jgi:hypothetical protein
MVASIGAALWLLATLVPEYCLAILADAEMLGTPSMGLLVAVISGLPSAIMTPFVLIYWVQYLARVLVASADGEGRPPRPSDRNFEGLFSGLSPWVLWLGLGLGPGLLPLGAYWAAAGGGDPWIAAGLGLTGLPYVLMALAMGFLHDDALAAKPWAVLGTLARLSPSFVGLSLTIAATLGLAPAAFAGAFALREDHFRLYVLASLACWLLTVWTSIVAMRALGSYFGLRKGLLKWRRKRNRWGVNWTL